jgi:cysteine protease ATG4
MPKKATTATTVNTSTTTATTSVPQLSRSLSKSMATRALIGDGNERTLASSKYFAELDTLYLLGKHYAKPVDEKELLEDISSRLWFTYRRGFSQINGNGPDSDQGWGCMLRCGQMLLAETFMRLYLSRSFKWDGHGNTGNPFYWKILSYFRDEKLAPYSVQQIAMMGVSEGIQVGKWFGPNTIVQVLK